MIKIFSLQSLESRELITSTSLRRWPHASDVTVPPAIWAGCVVARLLLAISSTMATFTLPCALHNPTSLLTCEPTCWLVPAKLLDTATLQGATT